MSRIRFIEARFPDPDESRYSIEERFTKFLRKLRLSDGETEDPVDEDEAETITRPGAGAEPKPLLTDVDHKRIGRRAARVYARREANSGLAHLRREERDQLKPLSNGAQLIEIRSDDHADQLAAQLHAELPWMAAATTEVWQAMRRSVREGQPGLRLPPMLLDGPPGIGKSHWARRVGQLLGMPVSVLEATGEHRSLQNRSMRMKLVFDTTRHHYAFGYFDRVKIDGMHWRPVSSNEVGWVFSQADGTGVSHQFRHSVLSNLGATQRLRVEQNYFSPIAARQRLDESAVTLSELSGRTFSNIVEIRSDDHADQLAAQLHAELPWMSGRSEVGRSNTSTKLRSRFPTWDWQTRLRGCFQRGR